MAILSLGDTITIQQACHTCHHTGTVTDGDQETVCPTCDGTRTTPREVTLRDLVQFLDTQQGRAVRSYRNQAGRL